MKKMIAVLAALAFLFASAFADSGIPPLKTAIIKYNSVASAFGAAKIDESTLTVENNANMFMAGSCMVALYLNDDGIVTNGGVLSLPDTDGGEYLRTCMVMVSFLGKMDYEAYGHILYQYTNITSGKESILHMIGNDYFVMSLSATGPMLLYYNYDLKTWY